MAGEYFPTRESQLVTWSTNFSTLISAAPAQYGLDASQAATFAGLHAAFVSAFQTANDPGTRTPSAIVTKNEAKEALVNAPGGIRELVRIIQNDAGTTDTDRRDLGITIRDTEPSPVPAPADAPRLSIVAVIGRLIKVRLRDQAHPAGRRAGRCDFVSRRRIAFE